MASFTFDATAVEPQQSNGPIPAGTYLAQVIESDLKHLKSGNGMGLALTFQILDGEHKNRRLWTNLNVQHSNPTAQQIGQQQLSSLCRALNVPQLKDTIQLHNKPLKVRVKIRIDATYGDKNEITAYEPAAAGFSANAAPFQQQAAQAQAPTQAAPAAPAKAPWM